MTNQEMKNRIEELEAELERLRKQKAKADISKEFAEQYPFVKKMGRTPQGQDACLTMSVLIRQVCFPPMEKVRWSHGKNKEYLGTISVAEMTSEQRTTYMEIVQKILGVLSEYEILSKMEGDEA